MIHHEQPKSASNSPVPDALKTVFAWATPPGRSGVAVLRLSGAHIALCCGLLGLGVLKPRQAHLRALKHPEDGRLIDQALALFFPGPHSFTGEDVLELHTHGSVAVRHLLSDVLSALPFCRVAEPGEFTRRAFLNGKMDLAQVEGLADVIDAQSSRQLAQGLEQMNGSLSRFYDELRDKIVRTLALIEAYIDFPDEEIPEETLIEVRANVAALQDRIAQVLQEARGGEKIREGFKVAIVGPPNAGKSSLLNAIARRDVAIVSDIAGTTRDAIEVQVELGGLLVTLVDTAGIRETQDQVESLGIERSHRHASEADLVIALDDVVAFAEQPLGSMAEPKENALLVLNKCDQSMTGFKTPEAALLVSAKTGEGVSDLLEKVSSLLSEKAPAAQDLYITRQRHRRCLLDAQEALGSFAHQHAYELMAEELRLAAVAIGKITGKIEVDQLLDVIFSEFCIGK
jgi:tRNA modification GTPase